jgi:ubiquitin C-terminal hydrolase
MNKMQFDSKWVAQSFGLTNPNSLCYFNSLLQAMVSQSAPNQYILNTPITDGDDNDVWREYVAFVNSAITGPVPKNAIGIITALKERLQNDKRRVFGRGQEDAGEGFHLLLDMMGNDEYAQNFMHRYTHDIYCTKCEKIVSTKCDMSFHVEIPPGYDKNQRKWSDDETTPSTGPLNKYIRHHTTTLDDFNCPECKEKQKMIRMSHIVHVPNVIVVQFNKFAGKFISTIPTVLVFPGTNGTTLKYMMTANIKHSGNMNGGHYVTNCLRFPDGEKRIQLMNDRHVTDDNFDSSSSTYIVWYHRF